MPNNELLRFITMACGFAVFGLMISFAIASLAENERRAADRALLLALVLPIPYLLVSFFSFAGQVLVAWFLVLCALFAALVYIVPIGPRNVIENDGPRSRVDERDIMFSRRDLQVGSERFNDYYGRNPDKKALDDNFRKEPGLLQQGSTYCDTFAFAAARASFMTVATFKAALDQEPHFEKPVQVTPEKITTFIKNWARKLGAISVGIAELKDYHIYTHIGRGENYGQAVDLQHKYAIAITVEMDRQMLARSPFAPTVMESAQQYLASGAIAVQLAEFIHNMGYRARAHIDGSYRVICPLVARDAGLGEIGRMGLLMTPELGPRVRLAVVTTDLPLVPSRRRTDYSVIDFCRVCKKCAEACPSRAISFSDRAEISGAKRWKIDSEACFTFWCRVGTDCARCVRVCPYSHPSNLMHNIVRFGVRNSSVFRLVALKMDDWFYGRKPTPLPFPHWMSVSGRNGSQKN